MMNFNADVLKISFIFFLGAVFATRVCECSIVAPTEVSPNRSESEHEDSSGRPSQNRFQAINLLLYGQLKRERA